MGTKSIPAVPNWDTENKYSYEDSYLDYHDMDELNKKLINIGVTLKYINKKMANYEKQKARVDVSYKRKYREAFLAAEVKTESHRRLYAEMAVEDLELRQIYLEQTLKELQRVSYSLRTELDILQTLGYNLRKELTL